MKGANGLMRVAIDFLSTIPGKSGAVGFWRNMLRYLPEIDKDIEYIVFSSPYLTNYYKASTNGVASDVTFVELQIEPENKFARILNQGFIVPKYCKKFGVDIHFTNDHTPFHGMDKTIEIFKVTGLQFLYNGQLEWKRTVYQRWGFNRKINRSRFIIANSVYTKNELLKNCQIPEARIKVIYESLDHEIFNTRKEMHEVESNLKKKYNIDFPYILFVSDIRPYKNPVNLVKAFKILVDKYCIKEKLVMIGQDIGGHKEKVKNEVKNLGIDSMVIFYDFLAQNELVDFYRKASLFVYLSSLETFGIPPLEAMACGTPVVASNRTAVPEIVADAACIVEPENIESIADGIFQVLEDYKFRYLLKERGIERVKNFSWQKNAVETVKLFKCDLSW